MKIVVCIKQVPAKDAPLAITDASWIRETDIGFEMKEPDSFALEEALRMKEKHTGEVIAVSMGPERVKQTIKEALAKGADRGVHIADDKAHTLDPLGAAKSLAAAIEREKPDLILTGLQSEDQGFGQSGVLLAELLGRPHATIIMAIEVIEERLKLKRELERDRHGRARVAGRRGCTNAASRAHLRPAENEKDRIHHGFAEGSCGEV